MQVAMSDPAELLIKEARDKSRRRHLRWASMFSVPVAACLIAIGVVHYISSPTRTNSGRPDSSSRVLTCPNALVKLLGVSAISGGLGHAGLLVRASVTSSTACTMSGYPIVGVELTDRPTAMASDMRLGYLGGFANASAPLPRLSITSRSRAVSFTIQMAGCNARPPANAIRITLPGSLGVLTARSMYEPGIGVIRGFGVYCGHLFVTPLVKGTSGNGK
jgi:hypothetical protein